MESDIQKKIIEYLKLKHIFCYRNNSGSYMRYGCRIRYGEKGSPDIVCIIMGHYIGIEVKDKKEKQSKEQIEFQERVEGAGGYYLLVRSLDELLERLDAIDKTFKLGCD